MRKSCILMHISSLPSEYGIGKMGKHAFDFVDFLKSSGGQVLADTSALTYELRRFALSVIFCECRKSLFYRL